MAKVKKFDAGGLASMYAGNQPQSTVSSYGNSADSSNSNIYNGLNSISEGSNKLAESLTKIQDAVGQPSSSSTLFKKGGKVSSASKRADGCAIRGKTRA
jgi:hypothetical protein